MAAVENIGPLLSIVDKLEQPLVVGSWDLSSATRMEPMTRLNACIHDLSGQTSGQYLREGASTRYNNEN